MQQLVAVCPHLCMGQGVRGAHSVDALRLQVPLFPHLRNAVAQPRHLSRGQAAHKDKAHTLPVAAAPASAHRPRGAPPAEPKPPDSRRRLELPPPAAVHEIQGRDSLALRLPPRQGGGQGGMAALAARGRRAPGPAHTPGRLRPLAGRGLLLLRRRVCRARKAVCGRARGCRCSWPPTIPGST